MNDQKQPWKFILLLSLGAGLEYYDFIVYAMLSPYLKKLFFSSESLWMNSLQTFGLFAVGYLARPLGGLIFGFIGDHFGRRASILAIMLIMSLSTLFIGLAPTYETLGPAAGILLILLRFIQGLSFGGELPGAVTIVSEKIAENRHSTYVGLVMAFVGSGSLLAAFTLQTLTKNLSEQEILNWGWRIPFILGSILALVSFFIRNLYKEKIEKRNALTTTAETTSFFIVFRRHKRELVNGLIIALLPSILVVFFLYLPEYLSRYFSYPLPKIYSWMTFAQTVSVLILPFLGMLSDKINKKRFLKLVFLSTAVIFTPLFLLLNRETEFGLIIFLIGFQVLLSGLVVAYLPILAEGFPKSVRFTGVALSYNLAYFIASLIPAIVGLSASLGYPQILVPLALCFLSIWAFRTTKNLSSK